MKLDNAARNLRVLWRADSLIAEIRLRALVTRTGLYAVAALVGVFGLLMLDFAAYLALADRWGPVNAAAAVGAADLIIALVLVLVAAQVRPGHDLEFATEIHKSAMDALAADLKVAEGEVRQLTDIVRHPLDSALPGLVVPLVGMLLKGFRRTEKT